MAVDTKRNRNERVAAADKVGKVFVVMAGGMRQCLVCDRILTRQASAEHARVECRPERTKQ